MNTEFFKAFYNTLVFNVATIAAIVVGLISFVYCSIRDWYNQGGREFLITTAAKFAALVNKFSEKVYYILEDAETVTV